jgi:acyl-CoA reductase-like NAD-dependent aldehyde dehydrogenase
VASSRIYVQQSIAQKFIEQYTSRIKASSADFGDPQNPETKYGPLADTTSFSRVQQMIERAKTKAEAELVVGGNRIGDIGCYIEPTVFLNPKDDAEIYKNEVFGPVAVIKTFETEEEVISMANDTEYGLMAGVFTRDINRALRVSQKIESGVVGINCISVMNTQVPFGGKKASGYGREFGEYVSHVLYWGARQKLTVVYL